MSGNGDIGVLVVHGIGDQERGETLDKLLHGLGRVEGFSLPESANDVVRATVGGQSVRFYEVYWADLLKGQVTLGNFQMNELQSISWFPWLNFRSGKYQAMSYSPVTLLWWFLVLPVANFLVLLAYYGASFLSQIVSSAKGKRRRPGSENEGLIGTVLAKTVGRSNRYTKVDAILDEYVGDIFSYVNSAGEAFYRESREHPVPPEVKEVYARIVQRFYDQLLLAQSDGCQSIQIVAHSLGTVVTYHALAGLRFEPRNAEETEAVRSAIGKISRLYTIGSPLEKVRFFWPSLIADIAPLTSGRLQWDNFVSWFDPVAGHLTHFDDWGNVSNHRLLGGGFIRGHVVYERSQPFLEVFTQGLGGQPLAVMRPPGERWKDLAVLVGEMLLAPAALVLVLVLGAIVFALTISLLPFLLSLPLRLFLQPETWAPIVDGLELVVALSMFVSLLMASLVRARRVHALHWTAGPDAGR